jgi:hypothetical protein
VPTRELGNDPVDVRQVIGSASPVVERNVQHFLAHAYDGLQLDRDRVWKHGFAVGVLGARRAAKPLSIPVLLVGRFHRPYRHLLRASAALVAAYSESNILPDVHLMSLSWFDALEAECSTPWRRARSRFIDLLPA